MTCGALTNEVGYITDIPWLLVGSLYNYYNFSDDIVGRWCLQFACQVVRDAITELNMIGLKLLVHMQYLVTFTMCLTLNLVGQILRLSLLHHTHIHYTPREEIKYLLKLVRWFIIGGGGEPERAIKADSMFCCGTQIMDDSKILSLFAVPWAW